LFETYILVLGLLTAWGKTPTAARCMFPGIGIEREGNVFDLLVF
jgi:hypothetical protein